MANFILRPYLGPQDYGRVREMLLENVTLSRELAILDWCRFITQANVETLPLLRLWSDEGGRPCRGRRRRWRRTAPSKQHRIIVRTWTLSSSCRRKTWPRSAASGRKERVGSGWSSRLAVTRRTSARAWARHSSTKACGG